MSRMRSVGAGITWNVLAQVFDVFVSFAAMLVLVRLLGPAEYGRAAAVAGLLTLLNIFNAVGFYSQALQLADDAVPNWGLHWAVGFYLHMTLLLAGHFVAGLCWFFPSYRPIAPLLHIGAFGFLCDWPSQLAAVMSRRALDFRRLRVVGSMALATRLASTLILALFGWGAYAIVIGNHVVSALPFAVDLLIVRRWRPPSGWWRVPAWHQYGEAMQFGCQRLGVNALAALSGALESVVLPASVGYGSLGLLTRARGLYGTTLGRVSFAITDTVYPFLPRVRGDRVRFAEVAALYCQVIVWLAVPSALFVGLEGPRLSRALYGTRWIAMDPLIWPGAVGGFATSVLVTALGIALAANRLRATLAVEVLAAVLSASTLLVARRYQATLPYAWAASVAQSVSAGIALAYASRFMRDGWWRDVLTPAVTSGAISSVVVLGARALVPGRSPIAALALSAFVMALSTGVALRFVFADSLGRLLDALPGGARFRTRVGGLGGWALPPSAAAHTVRTS